MITIVNLRNTRNCTRVDRATVLGNPFRMASEADRDTVCDRYSSYCWQAYNSNPEYRLAINALVRKHQLGHDIALGCWCAPKRCHAESIRDLVLTLSGPQGCPEEVP